MSEGAMTSHEFSKPTNPKDSIGIRKPRFWNALSWPVLRKVGLAMMEGAFKYGRHNYREADLGVRASVYFDATIEHLTCWWEGEDFDPRSDLSHVIKAIASLMVLADAMESGNLNDDRPPRIVVPDEQVTELQPLVDKLFQMYPEAVPAFTELRRQARLKNTL